MATYTITAEPDYVHGYLRNSYYILELDEEEYKKFEAMNEKEQIDWIESEGKLEVTDFRVEEIGSIRDFEVHINNN
jgi:hypothetical protein